MGGEWHEKLTYNRFIHNQMRKLTLFLAILSFLLAQSQNVALHLTEMNLVYRGIDNPVNIVVEGVKNEDIIIATSEHLLYSNGNIQSLSKSYGEGFVYVGKRANQDTVWLDTITLRLRSLPQPSAQLGGIPTDGLPKGLASVQAQTALLATMGAGFAYNLLYTITSYKCIIAYQNKPPVMFSGNSPSITSEMREAMQDLGGGDRILFEEIKAQEKRYGFIANLPPIIIQIRGYPKNPNSLVYARIKNEDTNQDTLITNTDDIARYQLSLKNGIIDFFAREADGFTLTTSYIVGGKVISRSLNDDYGRLQEIHQRLDSNSWKYTQYYWDGTKKLITTYTEGVVLKANDSFADCFDNAQWASILNSKPDPCDNDVFIKDLAKLFMDKKIAATDSFTTYYPNGNIKLMGKLVTLEGMEEPHDSFCGTGITYYDYSDHTVMDGKWLLYGENGELLDTQKYNKGTFIR
jgi:antitoxin component YwqK of YwqJK toxin-antitoxin module